LVGVFGYKKFIKREDKMEKCPKCNSMFIEWRGGNQRFECLQKDCLHTWTLESAEG